MPGVIWVQLQVANVVQTVLKPEWSYATFRSAEFVAGSGGEADVHGHEARGWEDVQCY